MKNLIKILVDAGPLIALFNKDDKYHRPVITLMRAGNYKFVTTSAVLTEVLHMLDFNINAQLDFLGWVMNKGVLLHEVQAQDIARIIYWVRKYQDLPMDFADATLLIAAEKTGIRSIISIDSDFNVYRLPGKEKIENVFSVS